MTISDRLDEVQVRYSEWHSDRGDHTPAPNTDTWSDADHPDESMEHCIVRNDVPALVAALRAVLDLHKQHPDEGMGWREDHTYGYVGIVCATCGTPDEYGVPWPCPTVRAVAAVLDN